MVLVTQRSLVALLAMLSFAAPGCADNFPTSAQAQQSSGIAKVNTTGPPRGLQSQRDREYKVVDKKPDGSTAVQFQHVEFVTTTRSVESDENGTTVERTYTTSVAEPRLVDVTVPAGADITQYLDERYPRFVEPPEPKAEQDLLYEVVEIESDGTRIAQLQFTEVKEEIRTRTVTRDGKTIEQCYALYVPVSNDVIRVHVPPGRDVLEYLDEMYPPVDSATELPPAPAPDLPPPPVPVFDPDE